MPAWWIEFERQVAGAVGSASARVMIASVAQEEPLAVDDVIEILEETSQLRVYARALEEKSRSLEVATVELRAANEQLKSLDQLKDDFVSSVTHELRTPLTSIRALSELMLDAPEMDAAQRANFLRILVSESERLSRLVNQVLDMAKIESGLAEWHSADVDMRALVENAVATTSELFRERGARVEVSLPPKAPPVRADPDRLMQVMVNLLSNASKFVPAKEGRVDVALRCEGDGVVVEVRDNGPGVPPAEQASVFEKFRQGGDASSRPTGTGLGLPISRQIVDHFGGSMWLEFESGTGRVLCLPPSLWDDRRRYAMPVRILVADDAPNIVVSLEYMLKREGYEVLVARDGREALETIRSARPELVLLDANMPQMSGFEVCEAVRADARVRETRILMLTAKGRETDMARGMGVGVDAYVTKPFSTRDLVQKVRDLLS